MIMTEKYSAYAERMKRRDRWIAAGLCLTMTVLVAGICWLAVKWAGA